MPSIIGLRDAKSKTKMHADLMSIQSHCVSDGRKMNPSSLLTRALSSFMGVEPAHLLKSPPLNTIMKLVIGKTGNRNTLSYHLNSHNSKSI